MRELKLSTSFGPSKIGIGQSIDELPGLVDGERCLLVVDGEVRRLHASRLPPFRYLELPAGEENKTLAAVEKIYSALAAMEADRTWSLVGLGGGTVSDIAGFAASTYMRGIRFGFAPTTLLAQVDAAVGGKNGVNFGGYKNLVGSFRQPDFVICDQVFLGTLPDRDYRSGFAEIIKHAILASESYFSFLESHRDRAEKREAAFLEHVIGLSIEIKASVVMEDPDEKGKRKILNLGHTIGHGLELVCDLSHGEAVSIGIAAACILGRLRGILSTAHSDRIVALLSAYGLPVSIDGGKKRESLMGAVLEAIRHDKKRSQDTIDFIIPEKIGLAAIVPVPMTELERVLRGVVT